MTDSTKAGLRCPMCGETAPEPASLCLALIAGVAGPGEPCPYSREGEARCAAEMEGAPVAFTISRARATGIPVQGGDDA